MGPAVLRPVGPVWMKAMKRRRGWAMFRQPTLRLSNPVGVGACNVLHTLMNKWSQDERMLSGVWILVSCEWEHGDE